LATLLPVMVSLPLPPLAFSMTTFRAIVKPP
jgi:hypothetical protein